MVINKIPFGEPNERKSRVGLESPASTLRFPSTSCAFASLDQTLVLIRDSSYCDSGLTHLSRTSGLLEILKDRRGRWSEKITEEESMLKVLCVYMNMSQRNPYKL